MKLTILRVAIVTALTATPLLAEDGMKCGCMKEHDAKAEMQKKMEAKMRAGEADLNALLEQMNATTGDKKIDAMAALLNKLLQERKAMHQKPGQEKSPDGEPTAPAEHHH